MAEPDTERGRWLEPALAFVALVFVVITNTMLVGERSVLLWVTDVVLCLAVAVAGRWPLQASIVALLAVAMQLFGDPSRTGASSLAVFIAVFAMVRLKTRYWVPMTLVLSLTTFLVTGLRASTNPGEIVGNALLVAVMLTLSVGGGMLWRASLTHIARERELGEQRVAGLRAALARDLHDTVAQTLSHAAMRAYIAAGDPHVTPGLRAELEQIAAECSSSAQDLRQLLSSLRESEGASGEALSPSADASTLSSEVRDQAGRLRSAGLEPSVSVRVEQLSAARATTLSKVTVEAVTNMIKYAPPGSQCSITIADDEEGIVAEYANPTSGPDTGERGMGLVGIQERAALLGGTSEVTVSEGWWRLRVTLPPGYESRASVELEGHPVP